MTIFTDFYPYGGIPDIGNMVLSILQALFHLSGAQGGISCPTRLVLSLSRLVIYQQADWGLGPTPYSN